MLHFPFIRMCRINNFISVAENKALIMTEIYFNMWNVKKCNKFKHFLPSTHTSPFCFEQRNLISLHFFFLFFFGDLSQKISRLFLVSVS